MEESSPWLLLLANLPIVTAFFYALNKKIIVMGETFTREMEQKDKEIEYREKLRQEALEDNEILRQGNKEVSTAMGELATGIKQTLDLNERLLDETLNQRWDQINDRRSPAKTTTRTR